MFVRYDPTMRTLLGTEVSADPEALASVLTRDGVDFVYWNAALPGYFEECGVDFHGQVVLLFELPESCRVADVNADVVTSVPKIAGLPSGAVVTPAVGTQCSTGTTYVTVQAPLYRPHRFAITVFTAQDRRNELVAYARSRRWELEQLGAPYGKMRLATDDRCKLLIQSTVTAVDLMIKLGKTTALTWSTIWTFLDGKASIKRVDLDGMILALVGYVSGLFDACNAIEEKIAADAIISTAQIDSAFETALKAT